MQFKKTRQNSLGENAAFCLTEIEDDKLRLSGGGVQLFNNKKDGIFNDFIEIEKRDEDLFLEILLSPETNQLRKVNLIYRSDFDTDDESTKIRIPLKIGEKISDINSNIAISPRVAPSFEDDSQGNVGIRIPNKGTRLGSWLEKNGDPQLNDEDKERSYFLPNVGASGLVIGEKENDEIEIKKVNGYETGTEIKSPDDYDGPEIIPVLYFEKNSITLF